MENKNETRRDTPLANHNDPQSNREHQGIDYPAYPHHPAQEDILNKQNHLEQVDVDVEKLSRSPRAKIRIARPTLVISSDAIEPTEEELLTNSAGDPDDDVVDPDAEVTEEDLELLGDPDEDMDGGDDELMEEYKGLDDTDFDGDPLNERTGHSGSDLDLPGDDDDYDSSLDPEDEENDFYSLGADKDSLEDDKAGDDF